MKILTPAVEKNEKQNCNWYLSCKTLKLVIIK